MHDFKTVRAARCLQRRRPMRRGMLVWSGLLIVLATLTSARRADAIRGGSIDRTTDAVVLATPGKAVCSGVAIAPDVVITAAHCLADDLGDGCSTPYPVTRAA